MARGRGRTSGSRMSKKSKKEMIKINPTFFKVLVPLGDFPDRLWVPPVFVKNYLQGSTLPNKVHLMACRNYSGQSSVSWRVKMEKIEDGCYITQGWREVVKDLVLEEEDFLVFELLGDKDLGVVPYGPTCCEKGIDIEQLIRSRARAKGAVVNVESEEEEEEEDGDERIQFDDETSEEEEEDARPAGVRSRAGRPSSSARKRNPYFEKSLKKNDICYLTIPAAITQEAGQWDKRSAVIRGPEGREWSVAIKLRTSSFRRLDISTGWRAFFKGTGLSRGDTVRFEFLGGRANVIEARVLSKASRPKGRSRR